MNVKITLSLILLTSFACCLHGMEQDQEEKTSKELCSTPLLVQKWKTTFPIGIPSRNHAITTYNTVQFFSPRTCTLLPEEKCKHPQYQYIHCAALSRDGTRLATIAHDKRLRLWNVKSNTCTAERPVNNDAQGEDSLIFSPGESRLAHVSTRNGITTWNPNDLSAPATYFEDPLAHQHGRFADEDTLVYARHPSPTTDTEICFLNVGENKLLTETSCEIQTPIKHLGQAALAAHIVVATAEKRIFIYNTHRKVAAHLSAPTIVSAALSPRGRYLLRGTRALQLYELNPDLTKVSLIWEMPDASPFPITTLYWGEDDEGSIILRKNMVGDLARLEPSAGFQKMLDSEKEEMLEENEEDEETLND